MIVDPASFRRTIGLFASGVAVISVRSEREIHAMTASSVTSVSLEPMLVSFCVSRRTKLASLLDDVLGFTINVLRRDQQALSAFFAGSWREPSPPPCRFVPWDDRVRLEGCAAAVGCSTYRMIEAGDHWLVLGEVRALHRGVEPIEPLLFFNGRYAEVRSGVGEPAPELIAEEAGVHVFYEP